MLLREFKVEGHTIILNQDGETYIAQIVGINGEKMIYHEYNEYDKIKPSFDEIVAQIQQGSSDINNIMTILERSTM